MKKNYKRLMQTKGINDYFKNNSKNFSKLNIYDIDTMKSQLQVNWKELTYEDLKLMEETIEKDINNSNLITSLLGTGISILIALWIGYAAIFIGVVATDEKINKDALIISVSIFIVIFVLIVSKAFIHHFRLNRKNIRLQTIVRILLDIKKSEKNT